MNKLFIGDLDLKNKRVLVRVDFNVPLKNGEVQNDKRLRASLPTIEYLIKQGARTILMSHLGRPHGKRVDSLKMAPVAKSLSALLHFNVKHVNACIGDVVNEAVLELKNGEVLLLENLRFYPEEGENDEEFARELARNADYFVNDAFGTAHRAHASTKGVTKFVEKSATGYLMKAELESLNGILEAPAHPYIAILGGSKVSSKIEDIRALLGKVDILILGGAMTHTFLKACGFSIGKSVYEADKTTLAGELLKLGGDKIILPSDYLITDFFDFASRSIGSVKTISSESIPAYAYAVDIGPESRKKFCKLIKEAKTIIWNGPLGIFEIGVAAHGTFEIANAIAAATSSGAISVIGGGDSVAAIEKAGLENKISHLSTGGGALLKFLEEKSLPGVEALTDK